MSDDDKWAVAKLRFDNANRCLNSANLLLDEGDYKSAANRSYYAIFYAIRAILSLDGKDFKKHSAVISYFRKEYIKTGKFESVFSNTIAKLFEVRTDSDYDDFYIISKDEVADQITNASCFINAVKEYLLKNGLGDM